ncbi:RNA polymerase sigma factor [Agromyces sp. ZXT2-6]|uniref:RNA polymerase sigma factor n=1 Tax=Agromyces sp. ZXT2-6 TaxID=3461153 RepID=UPI00405505CF
MTISEGDGHPADRLQLVSDEILVERAVHGDVAAFQALVQRHGPLMRAYTSRIVGSRTEADDVVQESFIIAWRQLHALRNPGAVRAWLMRIASREALAHVRRRPSDAPLPPIDVPGSGDTRPENVAVRNAELRALSAALDRLPDDQRQCWLLREIAELSYTEIAEEMHLPPATVRGKLARARANVTAQMEGWK